jgi:hypothetical protein
MNLSDLRGALRSRIGNPSTTDVPDTPNLDKHINDACQEILNKYKFKRRRARAQFTTVAGQDKYSVAALTDVVYKAWDRTNGRELTYVGTNVLSEQDYNASPNNLVVNGKPDKWAHIETYLQILPPPDGAYCIEFVYKVIFVALTSASDVPVIPLPWHRGIYILASALYYDDEASDHAKAVYHRGAFKDWVSDQPVEEHEQTEAIDSGVEIPTLSAGSLSSQRKPDGIAWDTLP